MTWPAVTIKVTPSTEAMIVPLPCEVPRRTTTVGRKVQLSDSRTKSATWLLMWAGATAIPVPLARAGRAGRIAAGSQAAPVVGSSPKPDRTGPSHVKATASAIISTARSPIALSRPDLTAVLMIGGDPLFVLPRHASKYRPLRARMRGSGSVLLYPESSPRPETVSYFVLQIRRFARLIQLARRVFVSRRLRRGQATEARIRPTGYSRLHALLLQFRFGHRPACICATNEATHRTLADITAPGQ